MPTLTFDLEVVCRDEHAEQIMAAPFDKDTFTPKNNAKNPDVIARQLEDAAAEWESGKLGRVDACALSARTGRIVAAGLAWDGKPECHLAKLEREERSVLSVIWSCLHESSLLIGFNSMVYDLPMVINRSALLGVKPALTPSRLTALLRRYQYSPHFDTRMALSAWDTRAFGKLHEWTQAFGFEASEEDGSQIGTLHRAGKHDVIAEKCKRDVTITHGIYERLRPFYLGA